MLQNTKNYRPDIDGLRAIAVISVILYHINKSIISGGFIGVDIFFVISGYLITQHIIRDIEKNRFSIIEFYRKRIKRIFPVLLVVIAVTLIISLTIQRPADTVIVARSSFASIFSMANVYFWLFLDTSYFAAESSESPLLHLWSLGIEEQFYIFWPLILILIYKSIKGLSFFIIFTLIATGSFLLGDYLYPTNPSFVYYMLPTRAGELLIGALTAHAITRKGNLKIPKNIVTTLSITGAICIAGSLIFLSKSQVFPGFRAIFPTVGTALLIIAGHYGNSLATRILTLRPLIWVGLISYSAYLWHWPILAFARYSRLEIGLINGLLIFILTILLSWMSYYYIERPTRQYNGSAIKIFAYQFAIPSIIITVFTLIIMRSGGYFLHLNADEYRAVAQKTLPAYKYNYVCQSWEITPEQVNGDNCLVGESTSTSPTVLLWGDSNAAHFIGIIGTFAREEKFQFKNLEHSSCPPIFSDPEKFVSAKVLTKCRSSLTTMRKASDKYQVVIISASWPSYQTKSNEFLDVFFDTTKQLAEQGKLIILLGKIPVIPTYDRLCPEKSINLPYLKCNTASRVAISNDVSSINTDLKAFASKTKNVEYYDLEDYLCPNGNCSAYHKNGEALYYDTNHLSLSASWEIGNDIYNTSGVPFPFTLISSLR